MRLSEYSPGESGTITAIRGEGPVVQRLLEMGLVTGVEVKVVRVAPLGDPLEIEVNRYFLTLRKAEAQKVEVSS